MYVILWRLVQERDRERERERERNDAKPYDGRLFRGRDLSGCARDISARGKGRCTMQSMQAHLLSSAPLYC
jgi:hypothetical protein